MLDQLKLIFQNIVRITCFNWSYYRSDCSYSIILRKNISIEREIIKLMSYENEHEIKHRLLGNSSSTNRCNFIDHRIFYTNIRTFRILIDNINQYRLSFYIYVLNKDTIFE